MVVKLEGEIGRIRLRINESQVNCFAANIGDELTALFQENREFVAVEMGSLAMRMIIIMAFNGFFNNE